MSPNDLNNLTISREYKEPEKLTIGNGEALFIAHTGKSSFPTLLSNKSLYLENVLHVPSITKNLLSVSSSLTNIVEFIGDSCCVKAKSIGECCCEIKSVRGCSSFLKAMSQVTNSRNMSFLALAHLFLLLFPALLVAKK